MAEALYTASYVARTDQRPIDVVAELVEAMGGQFAFTGHQLRFVAGAYATPVLSLGDDDFAPGPISVQARVPREALFNVVTATVIDPANGWQAVDMPLVDAPAYIAEDGAELVTQFEYAAVAHVTQAQQLSATRLRRARQALTVSATFKLTAFRLELFDVVALTCSRYGWSDKPFEVIGKRWSLDGLVRLVLRETDPSIFSFGDTFDEVDAAPNTTLPAYKTVPPVLGLTLESGIVTLVDGTPQTRVEVSWTAITDRSVTDSGEVEIQFIEATASGALPSGDWPSWSEKGGNTSAVIPGLKQNTLYVFRARAKTGQGIKGDWTLHTPHTVAPVASEDVGVLFRAVARGYSDTGSPHAAGLYTEADALLATPTRSYMLAKIDRATGALVSAVNYDVYGDTANATALAAALNACDASVIVVVVSADEPKTNRTSNGLDAAMYRCGASRPRFGSPEFKSRSAYILVGVPGCGEGNGWEGYQGAVDDSTTAWVDVSFVVRSGQLAIGASGGTPTTLADYQYTGDLNATADITLVPIGTMSTSGNNARKSTTGAAAWDASVYSLQSYTGGAFAAAVPAQANAGIMFGLNSDPNYDASYSSIDYAWYMTNAGTLEIYESGVYIGGFGTYVAGDPLSVRYDGARVVYEKAGVAARTIDAPAGLRLYFDSSFFSAGGRLQSIAFGPMSAVTGIDTRQITPGAVSQVQIVKEWSGYLFDWTDGNNATIVSGGLEHTITADADGGKIGFGVAGSISFVDNANLSLVHVRGNIVLQRRNAAGVVQEEHSTPFSGTLFVTPDSTPYNGCTIPFYFTDDYVAAAGEVIKYTIAVRNVYSVNASGAVQTPDFPGPGTPSVVLVGTASARELKV